MMRAGDNAKLAPEAEQAALDQLRAQREIKAQVKLQSDAQGLAMALGAMELGDVPAKAKELAADKKFGGEKVAAAMAITFNAVVRNGVPKVEEDEKAKKKGGGGKKGGGVKVAKLVDRAPISATEARKAIKAHQGELRAVGDGAAAELALLRCVEAWLLSTHGAVALPGASKVFEVIYDLELASEESLSSYWAGVQEGAARQSAELAAEKASTAALEATEQAASAAVKKAEVEQADAAYYLKQSEQYAQNVRCGNNPNKDEEAIEKGAIAQLKKSIELHTQSQKVLAARHKNAVAEKAELDTAQRSLADLSKAVEHRTPYVTHATAFFDWLAASDEESS